MQVCLALEWAGSPTQIQISFFLFTVLESVATNSQRQRLCSRLLLGSSLHTPRLLKKAQACKAVNAILRMKGC